MSEAVDNKVYCTVQQIVDDPSFCFSKSMIRYYILHAHRNGLRKAIRKIGRKVVIRRDLFIAWIEEQSTKRGQR